MSLVSNVRRESTVTQQDRTVNQAAPLAKRANMATYLAKQLLSAALTVSKANFLQMMVQQCAPTVKKANTVRRRAPPHRTRALLVL